MTTIERLSATTLSPAEPAPAILHATSFQQEQANRLAAASTMSPTKLPERTHVYIDPERAVIPRAQSPWSLPLALMFIVWALANVAIAGIVRLFKFAQEAKPDEKPLSECKSDDFQVKAVLFCVLVRVLLSMWLVILIRNCCLSTRARANALTALPLYAKVEGWIACIMLVELGGFSVLGIQHYLQACV